MPRFEIILINLAIIGSVAAGAVRKHTRIVGGSVITIDQAPYIVTLKDGDGHFCGGTLVTKRYVVTAAHCFNEINPDHVTVVGGASTLSDKGVERGIEKVYIPADYSRSTLHKDVAVIKLDKDMTGKNIQTLPLCSKTLKKGDMVQVSGWGLTDPNNKEPSEELRTISVPVIATEDCATMYKKDNEQITDTMFCASQPGQKDSCTMDSGGPLVFNSQLCGIVSWGISCASADHPGVYTNVNAVLNFINKVISR